jgi:hypothetical protein
MQRIGDLRLETEWEQDLPTARAADRMESIKGAFDWILNTGASLPEVLNALACVMREMEEYAKKEIGK